MITRITKFKEIDNAIYRRIQELNKLEPDIRLSLSHLSSVEYFTKDQIQTLISNLQKMKLNEKIRFKSKESWEKLSQEIKTGHSTKLYTDIYDFEPIIKSNYIKSLHLSIESENQIYFRLNIQLILTDEIRYEFLKIIRKKANNRISYKGLIKAFFSNNIDFAIYNENLLRFNLLKKLQENLRSEAKKIIETNIKGLSNSLTKNIIILEKYTYNLKIEDFLINHKPKKAQIFPTLKSIGLKQSNSLYTFKNEIDFVSAEILKIDSGYNLKDLDFTIQLITPSDISSPDFSIIWLSYMKYFSEYILNYQTNDYLEIFSNGFKITNKSIGLLRLKKLNNNILFYNYVIDFLKICHNDLLNSFNSDTLSKYKIRFEIVDGSFRDSNFYQIFESNIKKNLSTIVEKKENLFNHLNISTNLKFTFSNYSLQLIIFLLTIFSFSDKIILFFAYICDFLYFYFLHFDCV
ncbi:hypothetical protein [Leptospira kanakyensis]|uniref:Uncharacterized protein n=1 Tax=Leptospira kanakyensis TaxID=2484968 RepID=A0A6N4Q6E2_9LEPT|nr:hypothetical protein [Leptospira kanakyensis]TGK45963.1 hypothetical protein EHQ11_19645 [Leptospira kanakyensis]TGK70603.1 hypothetical protein EHQ18_09135 [Leptospira kanakyensis]